MTLETTVAAADADMDAIEAQTEALERELENDLENEAQEPPEGHLIDPKQYETEELALPKVDGESVDKIYASFGGRAWLDRADPRDCHLLRDLRMGQTVTLMVEATVGPPIPGYATNRDGDLDSITLGRKFTIEHVWRATPEHVSDAIAASDREFAEHELGTDPR